MRDRILTALASLRVRLIVTYVLVTAISFGFLVLLLIEPVGEFLMKREVDNLVALGITLGSTVRTPSDPTVTASMFLDDQRWTQRRCHDTVQEDLGVRVRMLDDSGAILTDSAYNPVKVTPGVTFTGAWDAWLAVRGTLPRLHTRREVQLARNGTMDSFDGLERERPGFVRPGTVPGLDEVGTGTRLFVAVPIKRKAVVANTAQVAFIMYLDKPVDSVRKNMMDLRGKLVLGMVISLLVTILVSIVLSSNLSAGLHAATQVAQAFAGGSMAARMSDQGRDEVGLLGKAFNRMAEALQRQEDLRRNLLADVSHELRTPLTAISACADTLTDGMMRDDPETAEHFLGIIIRESERLQRLVKDILELSKLQAGALPMKLAPLDLLPVIDDAVEVVQMHARQEGVNLVWVPPTRQLADYQVLGNADRLAQALRNLLDNARHHTPAGKTAQVTVAIDAQWVTVHVQDEGEGIPEADLPWVFDRFYRAGKGGKPGGTGLGLAIVREILSAHHGQVTVESTVGQGTTFTLYLPRAGAEK